MFNCVIALGLPGNPQLAAGTKPTGIVTRATVIRAVSRFDALEGIGLLSGDFLRTDMDSFLRNLPSHKAINAHIRGRT